MKRPYYNIEERNLIYLGTLAGDSLILDLRLLQFLKEICNQSELIIETLIYIFKKLLKLKA